jgi:ribonuclease P protein subunit RPR2
MRRHDSAHRTRNLDTSQLDTRPAAFRSAGSPSFSGMAAGSSSPIYTAASASAGREELSELQQRDISVLRRLPCMRGPGSSRRRGRRGRRTAAMIRAAHERIHDLFSLAESEARRSPNNLSRRYVLLARRIGMRYNVRLLREYRDLYCRGCSALWVEGGSVRTRLRAGRRTQTCLECGRVRRIPIKHQRAGPPIQEEPPDRAVRREQAVLIDEGLEMESESDLDEEEGP